MTGTDLSVRAQSGIEALPSSANAAGWTPQQRNLMIFAGLAKTIERDGQHIVIVPDPGVAEAFLMVCVRTGLDPFAKQIYAMEVKGKLSIVVGVDGFRVVAQRSKGYRGQIGPQWTADGTTWVDAWLPELQGGAAGDKPAAARIGILREGWDQPLWQVVTWAEFGVPKRFNGDNWDVRPAHMLGIRAETHGLRRTFPNDLSGLYTPEDFDDMDSVAEDVIDVKAMIAHVQAIRDLDELGRQYQEWNAIGMPEDVRKAIMAHGGVLKAEADARATVNTQTGEVREPERNLHESGTDDLPTPSEGENDDARDDGKLTAPVVEENLTPEERAERAAAEFDREERERELAEQAAREAAKAAGAPTPTVAEVKASTRPMSVEESDELERQERAARRSALDFSALGEN